MKEIKVRLKKTKKHTRYNKDCLKKIKIKASSRLFRPQDGKTKLCVSSPLFSFRSFSPPVPKLFTRLNLICSSEFPRNPAAVWRRLKNPERSTTTTLAQVTHLRETGSEIPLPVCVPLPAG